MSQMSVDPGSYRTEDRGSRWLLPLVLGLLALAVIAWLLFANPFRSSYGTTGVDTRPAVATVAPATGSGGTTGTTAGTTGTTGGSTGTAPGGTTGTTGTTGGGYGTRP
jgi:hypothetical protein